VSVEYPNRGDEPRSSAKSSAGNGLNPAIVAFVVVVALALIFFLQNGEKTQIDFLFFEKTTTKRWAVIVAIVLGIVLDRLFAIWWRRRRRRNARD
jgi:uncharacterized integral membrane protein